jgi:hypothetical protein
MQRNSPQLDRGLPETYRAVESMALLVACRRENVTEGKRWSGWENSRSLHYAPPDFLLDSVALANSMRLSLPKAAYADVSECHVVGNPGTLRSG